MTPRPGSASAAFAHRDFRRMWIGSFGSNIGTWMQTVVMGGYVYKLMKPTGNPSTYTGLMIFAQLVPLMALAMIGGVIADKVDRRKWLIALQCEQGLISLALAYAVSGNHRPSFGILFAGVALIGVGNAFNAPTWSAVFPTLVGRENLAGALALNSVMINGTRVVGPAIAAVLLPVLHGSAAWIFAINAITYLFVIFALLIVRLPKTVAKDIDLPIKDRFLAGLRAARQLPVVGKSLITIFVFSLLALPFIALFPAIAEGYLHIDSKSSTYGWFYATFGMGAMLGSLSVATVFTSVSRRRIVRRGLAGFAVMAFIFGLLRSSVPAFPVIFLLGGCYFSTTTALVTVLQRDLDDGVRARVMALWFMGFGGTVGIAGPLFGRVLDRTSSTFIMTISALTAIGLALWWWPRFTDKLEQFGERNERAHDAYVSDP
jgi:MFS family permease